MRVTTRLGAIGCAVLIVAGAACSDRTERRAEDAAGDAGRAASEAARDAGNAAASGARAAGDAVANAGRAADAAVETMDVKAALMADSRVDARDINVDTDHVSKTVVLKGRVPTDAQKTLAEQIAVEQAKGYRVQNNLTVGR